LNFKIYKYLWAIFYVGAFSPILFRVITHWWLIVIDHFTVRVLQPVRGRVGQMIKVSKWSMKEIDSNIWSLRIIVTDFGDVIIKCMTQFRPINWLDNESSIQEASYKWVEFEIQTRKMWEKQIFMKSKNNWLWAKKWIHKKIHWNVKMEQVM